MASVSATPVAHRTPSAVGSFVRASVPSARRALAQSRRASSAIAHATHKVTVLPGDGIGPEIMRVALSALEAAGARHEERFEFTEALIGGCAYDATGDPYPEETYRACASSDAVLLAAIGGYKWDALPSASKPETGLLRLRSSLAAFANLRPARVIPELADASSLKREVLEGVDLLIVRELVGGIYFGQPRGFETRDGVRRAFSTDVYAEPEIERIAHVAFRAARGRRGELCSVDKANVLEVSQLWREVVARVGREHYPDVRLSHMYVDNAAMQLVRCPAAFDTVLTSNLFGDILSDEAAMITGSLGMLPSASVGDGGPGVFEPIHGSAPDIAGQDKANPLAMVLSAALMCRHGLGIPDVADRLERAVQAVLAAGVRTADIARPGEKVSGCSEVGRAILDQIAA